MVYVPKVRTWKDNWLDTIRYVIFPDPVLRELMMLPKNITITQFIDKYFIESVAANEILTDEMVRITYFDDDALSTRNKNVKRVMKNFDIYVHESVLHNATNDRLKYRYDLIVERLKYLLTGQEYVQHMKYVFEDDYNLWTKTAGYSRRRAVFSYKKTV